MIFPQVHFADSVDQKPVINMNFYGENGKMSKEKK